MTSEEQNRALDRLVELDEEIGMRVFLLEWMGNDDSIVNAARVSFDKEAANYTEEQNISLLEYLAKHNHWSPFAHTCLKFRIRAPIFVARQLAKHQVGLVWNEVSRRYVKTDIDMWRPYRAFRKAAPNVKQGSSEELVDNPVLLSDYIYAVELAKRTYENLLRQGVCAEQARAVLPQGMYTEWIWTGSLLAFHRVVTQRTHSTAQRETQEIAQRIARDCADYFPESWKALERYA
jgi:thymidylate synthase (FAD)